MEETLEHNPEAIRLLFAVAGHVLAANASRHDSPGEAREYDRRAVECARDAIAIEMKNGAGQ